ncbi:MAG: radical SAM/Cys-rich domain protein [Desulfobacteraceae bacterium]|nr:MAG: radical SAM/Cys-rich domain protein [Desulfobacteraceae bacterium]
MLPSPIPSFWSTLAGKGLSLERSACRTLQINLGLLCNQRCNHCHLEAGPDRTEVMDLDTISEVIAYAKRGRFQVVDITGGAPELNPWVDSLIKWLSELPCRIIFRSNLTALNSGTGERILSLLKRHQAAIVASFPSLDEKQADSQRGKGVFSAGLAAIKRLNSEGYGSDPRYELDLVSNPAGAFLPPAQAQAEKRFREILEKRWGLSFHNLFTFANAPLGRFRQWLQASGNLEGYLARLASAFNSCALAGVMCRSLVSISWEGYLYDCDFNLSADLPIGGRKVHVSEAACAPPPGAPIATAEHCYTCTAGAGFT